MDRQIELAKSILESAGYTVTKRVDESKESSGEEILSAVGNGYEYWESLSDHIDDIVYDSLGNDDRLLGKYKDTVVSRIEEYLGTSSTNILVGSDESDMDSTGAVHQLVHNSKGKKVGSDWKPDPELVYTNLGEDSEYIYSFYQFADGTKYVVGTESYYENIVFIDSKYVE